MIRCSRCGSGFSSLHVATETPRSLFSDPLWEMTRRVERGRALLHDRPARVDA
jgi:hypothetical protein